MNRNLLTLMIVASTGGAIPSGLAQTKTSSASPAPAVGKPESSSPRIQFADATYDFGKINSGEVVKHDFVFTNTGAATLEIKDVRAGCGCTTAGTWDKQVAPGKTGTIPLQFNSAGFGGTVTKSATVTCNDPAQSNVVLLIKCNIWKAIDVTPAMAVFNLSSDLETNAIRVVRIVSNLEEPLELSDLQCTNRSLLAELKTVRPGKEFELCLTAVPPFPSTPTTTPVTLKTSSSKMPTINVSALVMVQQPVTVAPNQITLPAGQLAGGMSSSVAIRNNGTSTLALSEPRVNVPGPEARLQEVQQGRLFSLVVNFPAGFQVKPEERIEVSVKSNQPKLPLIKVPVVQARLSTVPAAVQKVSSRPRNLPSQPVSPLSEGK